MFMTLRLVSQRARAIWWFDGCVWGVLVRLRSLPLVRTPIALVHTIGSATPYYVLGLRESSFAAPRASNV
jgi:hypothetical protein